MESRAIYITVRVDLSVPDYYELSDGEIAEELEDARIDLRLPKGSHYVIDSVEICDVNGF